MALNEADTCRLHVTPKLQAAGWDISPHSLNEQKVFTDVQHRFAALCQRIEAARLRTLKLADQAGAAPDAIRRESFLLEHL